MKFKNIILAAAAVLLATSCMTVHKEETLDDRIDLMKDYALTMVNKEVSEPFSLLSLALRLDAYNSAPESERTLDNWPDLYGNVFMDEAGDMLVGGKFVVSTGFLSLRTPGMSWKFNNEGWEISCAGSDTWTCRKTGKNDSGIILTASLEDAEKNVWNLEYSSSDVYENKKAVLYSIELKGYCTGYLNVYYQSIFVNASIDAPVINGKVKVDFFSGSEEIDFIETEFKNGGVFFVTSRD